MAGSTQRSGGIIEGINVTPLVDVTLVLLVIFMVTAKFVVASAVPLDLPTSTQSEEIQTIFSVAVTPDGALFVDGTLCPDAELRTRAAEALVRDPELRAVIQADGGVHHRRVIEVMDYLKDAGIDRVAFAALRSSDVDSTGADVNEE